MGGFHQPWARNIMLTIPHEVQEAEPVMAANAVLPVVIWQYPPATLPKPPHGVSALSARHIVSAALFI